MLRLAWQALRRNFAGCGCLACVAQKFCRLRLAWQAFAQKFCGLRRGGFRRRRQAQASPGVYTAYNTPSVFFSTHATQRQETELCSWIQEEIDDYYHWESAARDQDDDTEHGVGRAMHPRHKILYFLF